MKVYIKYGAMIVLISLIFLGFLSKCATSAVTGFVESCEEMVITCYDAGHDFGSYLRGN